jgi:type VI secretion system protein ImpH
MKPLPRLGDHVENAPHRFDAFQALRLIELREAQLGSGARPAEEPARLVAEQGLAFAASPIRRIVRTATARVGIAFLGLTGPMGVLPQFYSEVVHQAVRQRNRAMAAFLDLFNHRLAALFLRASGKYRLPVVVQRNAAAGPGDDPVTGALFAITGHGTAALRRRMTLNDEVLLYYAGLFSLRNRPACGLESLLRDYLGTGVAVEQFSGRWTPLAKDEQTRLPRAGEAPAFCRLGIDTVAGGRVWDVQGHFRIVIGPMDYEQMLALAPDAPALRCLVDLVRAYAGPDLGFDVQIVLKRDCVPDLRFDPAMGPGAPRLGWNSWAKSLPALEDRRDIIIDPDRLVTPLPPAPAPRRPAQPPDRPQTVQLTQAAPREAAMERT